MDQTIFEDYKGKELIEMLESNSDGAEEMSYNLKLSQKEISDIKTEFAQKSIEEARLLDDFKIVKEAHKQEVKPITEIKSRLLTEIKTETREEYGKCYKIIEHEEKMVGFYNNHGQLVYQRTANAEEAGQMTITKSLKKTGTED